MPGEMWGELTGLAIFSLTLSWLAAALGRQYLAEVSSQAGGNSHPASGNSISPSFETAALRR